MGFLYRGLLFAVGSQAFDEGVPRADNPYVRYSWEAHSAWDDGWLAAQEAVGSAPSREGSFISTGNP